MTCTCQANALPLGYVPNPWLFDTVFHYIPQAGLGLVMQPSVFQTHGNPSPSSSMGARGMFSDSNFSKAIDTEERRKSEHCRFDGDGPNSYITYFLFLSPAVICSDLYHQYE